MKWMKHVSLLSVQCVLVSLTACQSSTSGQFTLQQQKGESLADVGGVSLTAEGLADLANRQGAFFKKELIGNEQKQTLFLDGQINQYALTQEALKRGYLSDPDVQELVMRVLAQKVARVEYEKLSSSDKISDAEVKTYYDSHLDEFVKPPKSHIEQIKIPFGTNKKTAFAEAQKTYRQLLNRKENKNAPRVSFVELAKKYEAKADANADKKGTEEVELLTKEETLKRFGNNFGQIAWDLKKGEFTKPLEGPDGVYILKKAGFHEGNMREIADVKSLIQRRILNDKRKEAFTKLIENLRKELKVDIHKDRLKKFDTVLQSLLDAPSSNPFLR